MPPSKRSHAATALVWILPLFVGGVDAFTMVPGVAKVKRLPSAIFENDHIVVSEVGSLLDLAYPTAAAYTAFVAALAAQPQLLEVYHKNEAPYVRRVPNHPFRSNHPLLPVPPRHTITCHHCSIATTL